MFFFGGCFFGYGFRWWIFVPFFVLGVFCVLKNDIPVTLHSDCCFGGLLQVFSGSISGLVRALLSVNLRGATPETFQVVCVLASPFNTHLAFKGSLCVARCASKMGPDTRGKKSTHQMNFG